MTGTTRTLTLRMPDGSERRIEATIPPGVDNGSRIRLAGQGGPGRSGGPAGDLYLVVSVASDPRFERDGDNLRTARELGQHGTSPSDAIQVVLLVLAGLALLSAVVIPVVGRPARALAEPRPEAAAP